MGREPDKEPIVTAKEVKERRPIKEPRMTDEEKREQVAKQCEAVSHTASALAQICRDYAVMFRDGGMDNLIEQVGKRTALQMETLGDMLNGTDAADESDDWMEPVFREAQRLWPVDANRI
jgi:hypothetical protein